MCAIKAKYTWDLRFWEFFLSIHALQTSQQFPNFFHVTTLWRWQFAHPKQTQKLFCSFSNDNTQQSHPNHHGNLLSISDAYFSLLDNPFNPLPTWKNGAETCCDPILTFCFIFLSKNRVHTHTHKQPFLICTLEISNLCSQKLFLFLCTYFCTQA